MYWLVLLCNCASGTDIIFFWSLCYETQQKTLISSIYVHYCLYLYGASSYTGKKVAAVPTLLSMSVRCTNLTESVCFTVCMYVCVCV